MEVKKVECTGKCYFVLLLALFQFMECGILLILNYSRNNSISS